MTGAPFPALPLDITADMYVNGDWHSIASDVYERSPISITRGVTDESTSSVASQCTFQLNNRAGTYDPNNALGPYYGSIGRGTPFRCGIRTGQDEFARTVSSGWGSADVGGAWATNGAGGTLNASDYSVAAGVGKHSVPAVGFRSTYLSTSNYFDVDVAVTCSVLTGTNVAGGAIELGNIILRSDGTNWYYVRVSISPVDQSVSLGLYATNNNGATTFQAVADIPCGGPTGQLFHTGNPIRVRALIEGQVVRAKAWDTTGTEPQDWLFTAPIYGTVFILYYGTVGIRSAIATGNTNAKPVVFSYSDFQVQVPRYAGQVASMVPTASDIAGKDAYTTITAANALRRITGSTAPLQSALRRSIPSLGTQLISYWPMEDGAQATSLASGLYSGAPMAINGTPSLASYTGFPSSAPIPTMVAAGTTSILTAVVPPYVPTGSWQVRCLVNAANGVAGSTMWRISTTGTIAYWDVIFSAGGGLETKAYAMDGTVLLDSTIAFAINNLAFRLSLQATVVGADTNYTVSVLPLGVGQVATYFNGTVTGHQAPSATAVSINPFSQCGGFSFGHLTVESQSTDVFALVSQFNAFAGEDAGSRFVRLCTENGIVGDQLGGEQILPALMGAQLVNTLSALLQECADADRGLIYEPRGATNALSYKALGARYYARIPLALSTATNDLGAYPKATYDDQTIHNTVTVMRPSGSSVTATQVTGPLGTQQVNTVGAQQVTANVQSDGQLNDLAAWIVHVGTVSDPRYPPLMINLLRPGNAGLMIPAASVSIDDKVTIAGLYPDLTNLLARGYNEQLGGHVWTITYNFAPESPFEIFTLDDTVLGRLDSDNTLLGAAIGAGNTSFGINAADGTLWTTNSADWPVLIKMGGEVMSVGAISGTTALQTFSSVTRAINGVSKSHAISEKINVAQPVYLALGRP